MRSRAMSRELRVVFPGRRRVDALYKGSTIQTDQPVSNGGEDSAPSPFDYFLTSIGTCAGYYVLNFCQSRNISTEGLSLSLTTEWNEEMHLIDRMSIAITLPPDFPEKYRGAVIKAAEKCMVKRHLQQPPQFDIHTV